MISFRYSMTGSVGILKVGMEVVVQSLYNPESYIAMDNFYTVTVYNKGSEVIRMYRTLLGWDGFRKGADLYFARHDGSAVTCDDFRQAMADATGRQLTWTETPKLDRDRKHRSSRSCGQLLRSCVPRCLRSGGADAEPLELSLTRAPLSAGAVSARVLDAPGGGTVGGCPAAVSGWRSSHPSDGANRASYTDESCSSTRSSTRSSKRLRASSVTFSTVSGAGLITT